MEKRLESRQRNGHKRNSVVHEPNAQFVQRRTSKKTSSKDRHGQIYPDDFADTTIRAVTPDAPLVMRSSDSLSRSTNLSLSNSSPHYDSPRGNFERAREQHVQSSSNGNSTSGGSYKDECVRPRTRTLEEKTRDRSPTSLIARTRNRLGSLHSTSAPPLKEAEEDSSIGFPSVVPTSNQSAQLQTYRQRLIKPPPRGLSPIGTASVTSHISPLHSPTSDTSKILQLMKTTCGRMHGILSFRTSSAGTWSSGYCAINVATGSLIYQTKGDVALAKTLIPDLRGCKVRTLYERETGGTFLDLCTHTSGLGIHLRPHVLETFDSWLAALLCWQPIRPKGVQNKMTKPQTATISGRRSVEPRRNSVASVAKDAAIIKVGKMLYCDKEIRSGASTPMPYGRASTNRQVRPMPSSWRKVSCTLQENGHLNLYRESDVSLVSVIPLSQLSRYAIQRLDPSVLGEEHCIAIYPQYTSTSDPILSMHPVYLGLDCRVLFEVWFVLLRAFTIPELYGPEQSLSNADLSVSSNPTDLQKVLMADMFRVERHFSVRIVEARLYASPENSPRELHTPSLQQISSKRDGPMAGYHAEIHLDGELRAKTAVKSENDLFWLEDYEFVDLPPVLSSALVLIKVRNPAQRDWTLVSHADYALDQSDLTSLSVHGDIEISPLDTTYGKVDLRLDDLQRAIDTEKRWPILDGQDHIIGEILMKVQADDLVVLMSHEYQQLTELLHSFSNGLTQQISQMVPSDLRKLSETLLNIFQVSAQAGDWLMSLVEDEIDGLHKETHISRLRYSRRIASNDSYESSIERELFLRDLGKSATVEANLLFRGNSLLTKALDLHMRRVGKEYLDETLMEKLRDIAESNPDCEVDPNRVPNPDDLRRNWRNLIALTENIWKSIYASASRCPPELRMIFRHIRACAEDRYGDFLRTVTYSSVSGFLFLRFFCPAVLNPKLFGLLKDQPEPRAKRTLTLIAKSLQTLANMTTFGTKEPWMEPMNAFLATHRAEFKSFIDTTCDISPDRATSAIPPSYATPITILGRLPATSREGFPSLPYLIDQARECAALVGLWLDGKQDPPPSNQSTSNGGRQSGMSEEVAKFDELCTSLMQRTRDCLSQAEQAERPSGVLEVKWEELVEQMDKKARLRATDDVGAASSSNNSNNNKPPLSPATTTAPSSQSERQTSLRDSHFDRQAASRRPSTLTRQATAPTPDDTTANAPDDEDEDIHSASSPVVITPPGSASSVWDPGVGANVSKPRHSENDGGSSTAANGSGGGGGGGDGGVNGNGNHSLGSSLYSLETSSHDRADRVGGAPPPSLVGGLVGAGVGRDGLAAVGKARFTEFVGGLKRRKEKGRGRVRDGM